jgi:hypothetical protein
MMWAKGKHITSAGQLGCEKNLAQQELQIMGRARGAREVFPRRVGCPRHQPAGAVEGPAERRRIEMKRAMWIMAGAVAAMGLAASGAMASTVWDGQSWSAPYGSIAVNGTKLDVTATTPSSGMYFGAAHIGTSPAFRSLSGSYISATFEDDGGATGNFLAFEQEGVNPAESWVEFGVINRISTTNYSIQVDNEYRDVVNGDTPQNFVLSIPRSVGSHTVKIELAPSGTVEFFFDGAYIQSTNYIQPDYFGDVYLFSNNTASGGVGTFTHFEMGAVPLPSSAWSGLGLLGGLAVFGGAKRLRRQEA